MLHGPHPAFPHENPNEKHVLHGPHPAFPHENPNDKNQAPDGAAGAAALAEKEPLYRKSTVLAMHLRPSQVHLMCSST